MRASDLAFVGALVHQFPVLLPVLQEHLDFYGDFLSHLLMGDITRWVVAEYQLSGPNGAARDLMDFVEQAFSRADEHQRELITASFLENFPRLGQPGAGIRDLAGPSLKRQLRAIG